MGVARLVVIEGPDLGREFDIPLRGGGIGREAGNVVQLADPSVSRFHCDLELRDGNITLVDSKSRNRTLVNGQPVSRHVLCDGDEITVGKTRLAYLPQNGGVAVLRQSIPGRTALTMEIGSRELLRAPGLETGVPGGEGSRARRHLAALTRLGDALFGVDSRERLGQAACEAGLAGLGAERVFFLVADAAGRMSPCAAAVAPNSALGAGLSLPREVQQTVGDGKAAISSTPSGPALAAPIYGVGPGAQERPTGLLYADRTGVSWDQLDLMAAAAMAHLLSATLAAFEARVSLMRENRLLSDQLGGREFVGTSPRARAVLDFVAKVGPSDATVLLTGESGSGKEMVARAIHGASRRSRAPFIAVNCAALTESLIESELFGHEKGAFTGATERKLGRFELADKGTLFLDEVGELPPNCQTKFLRVLEEQVFERVGGTRSLSVNVRVVAATNRDLPDMVRRGRFREDLFYRLSVIHTVVPPLRERAGDIPILAEHFLARLRSQVARRITGFSAEALGALAAHSWPGNVRELRNAVERAIVLGDGPEIRLQDLPPNIAEPAPASTRAPTAPFAQGAGPVPSGAGRQARASVAPTPPAGTVVVARPLRELEKDGIIAALRATGGNKARAAQLLEIDRSTLYKKLKEYGI